MEITASTGYLEAELAFRAKSGPDGDTMNRYERPAAQDEAVIQYLDGDFRVLKAGGFVLCAVTGKQIPLTELRYWSVERQEAYADHEVAMQVYAEKLRTPRD
jgi:hypothetical protein